MLGIFKPLRMVREQWANQLRLKPSKLWEKKRVTETTMLVVTKKKATQSEASAGEVRWPEGD